MNRTAPEVHPDPPTGPIDLPEVPGDTALAGDNSPQLDAEPPPGPSLIAQALRDAGLDPDRASLCGRATECTDLT